MLHAIRPYFCPHPIDEGMGEGCTQNLAFQNSQEKQVMNKVFRASIILLVLCALLMGATAPAAKAQNATNIRIFVGLGAGSQPGDKEKQDALAKEFNDSHKDIQIEFDVNPNVTARDVLLTQVAGDNPPDIVGPVGIRGVYEVEQLWADIGPFVSKDKESLKIDEYDEGTLKLFETAGGKKNLSIALGIYPSVLLVNEEMFAAAEVPVPPKEWGAKYTDRDGKEHVWDWETLGLVAQQVTSDENGVYADEEGFDPTKIVNYGFGNLWVQPRNFVAAWGSPDAGVGEGGKKATFDQEAYLNAFQWLHDGIYQGHFIPDQAGWGTINAGGTSPFESGKLGMWYSQSWYVSCCMSAAKFKWNVYAGPAVPGAADKIVSPLHADTFAILEKSKNKDTAWEVLKWLNSAETSAKLCLIYGCIPARKPARDEWEKSIKAKFPDLSTDVIIEGPKYQEGAGANNESAMPNYAQAADTLQAFYNSIQADADVDVKSELASVNKQIQDIFEGKIKPTEAPTEAAPEATMEATMEATEAS
jgi:multiple sugar transport system substrate-binding protein